MTNDESKSCTPCWIVKQTIHFPTFPTLWWLMNIIPTTRMNFMCNPKQHKMGMNFSYNMNSHFSKFCLEIWQKLKSQQHGSPHLLMWYSTTYGLQELVLIDTNVVLLKIKPKLTPCTPPSMPQRNHLKILWLNGLKSPTHMWASIPKTKQWKNHCNSTLYVGDMNFQKKSQNNYVCVFFPSHHNIKWCDFMRWQF